MGKKCLACYACLIWFSQVRNPTTVIAMAARGCENHIEGKSTKLQKIFLLVTLAESHYMTPLRNLTTVVAMVASIHAPIPRLKIISRVKAQKGQEIFSLAILTRFDSSLNQKSWLLV